MDTEPDKTITPAYGVSRQTIHNLARHKTRKSAGDPKYETKTGPQTNTGF